MYIKILGMDEVDYGQECIDRLWRKGHILSQDRELFVWQYRSRTQDRLNFYVAEDKGVPIGILGMIEIPLNLHGASALGAVASVFIVAPEYRASGAALELLSACYKNRTIAAAIGINDTVAKLYRMLRQYVLDVFPRYVCLANRRLFAEFLSSCPSENKPPADAFSICGVLTQKEKAEEGFVVTPLCLNDLDEWDKTWSLHFAPQMQGATRNAEYVKWRFFDHPRFHYDVLVVRNSRREICGLAICRVIQLLERYKIVRIVDFFANTPEAGTFLAKEIARRVSSDTLYLEHFALGEWHVPLQCIGMTSRGSNLFSTFTSPPDFRNCKITSSFFIADQKHNAKEFIHAPSTYFTLADGDQDRPA